MAKVRFYIDSGANIKSRKTSRILDTVDDLGLNEDEWESTSEFNKYNMAEEWAWQNGLDVGYEELDGDLNATN